MHALIELKFGPHAGQPKANISTKFGGYLTKIFVAISNYVRKKDLSFDRPTG